METRPKLSSVLTTGILLMSLWRLRKVAAVRELQYDLQEELPKGTMVGNVISDSNLQRSHPPKVLASLSFRLLTKPVLPFVIDQRNGHILTDGRIDRDQVCAYKAVCAIKLDVAIWPVQYFDVIKVTITLLDRNDNSPIFPDGSNARMVYKLMETSAVGTTLGVPTALDPDSPQFSVKTYSMQPAVEPFQLVVNNSSGNVELNIVLRAALDREKREKYRLKVVATDGGGKTGFIAIRINVLDYNDHGPVFKAKRYETNIEENAKINTSLITVEAVDQDKGRNGRIIYRFTERTLLRFGHLFMVTPDSGEIVVKGLIDYEQQTIYHLEVEASDQGAGTMAGQTTVVVRVLDQNDHGPDVTLRTLNSALVSKRIRLRENCKTGTFLAHVAVVDHDSGKKGEVSCRLTEDVFKLKQLSPTEYQISTAVPVDREATAVYNLTITCYDHASPPRSVSRKLRVDVIDENDNSPTISPPHSEITVKENNKPGAVLYKLNASDADEGNNARLQYRISADQPGVLAVNSYGVITIVTSLDREETQRISAYVEVSDMGLPALTSTSTILTTILDENDERPMFVKQSMTSSEDTIHNGRESNGLLSFVDNYYFLVAENQPVGTLVGTLSALDMDTPPDNNHVTFRLAVNHSGTFEVHPRSGQIIAKRSLDRETISRYRLIVVARDRGLPVRSSSATVTVSIEDVNDCSPKIFFPSKQNYTISISNQVPVGFPVAKISANDEDSGMNSRLLFSIDTDSDNQGLFHLNPRSGLIETAKDLSNIEYEVFILQLTVSDQGEPPLNSTSRLRIVINATIAYSVFSTGASPSVYLILVAGAVCGVAFVIIIIVVLIINMHQSRRRSSSKRQTLTVRHARNEKNDNMAEKQAFLTPDLKTDSIKEHNSHLPNGTALKPRTICPLHSEKQRVNTAAAAVAGVSVDATLRNIEEVHRGSPAAAETNPPAPPPPPFSASPPTTYAPPPPALETGAFTESGDSYFYKVMPCAKSFTAHPGTPNMGSFKSDSPVRLTSSSKSGPLRHKDVHRVGAGVLAAAPSDSQEDEGIDEDYDPSSPSGSSLRSQTLGRIGNASAGISTTINNSENRSGQGEGRNTQSLDRRKLERKTANGKNDSFSGLDVGKMLGTLSKIREVDEHRYLERRPSFETTL